WPMSLPVALLFSLF
ncbi:GhoT/OrtT family toxin, partial [Shigella sonnei]|nr:GhoT/OrtT family toxin [Escherichia coli]EIS3415496.1 GhoT/OrtT family toxin [Escherichia coli]EJA4349055.1 GhoT/OrtT family toxin [Escherichia coli]EKZ1960901.1 GhoT/OrtT family toxin [Shigella sonnei]HEI2998730.1 GhoT/OrtT family toxin [Escherichia coli]